LHTGSSSKPAPSPELAWAAWLAKQLPVLQVYSHFENAISPASVTLRRDGLILTQMKIAGYAVLT
jgi:hypothetical protein